MIANSLIELLPGSDQVMFSLCVSCITIIFQSSVGRGTTTVINLIQAVFGSSADEMDWRTDDDTNL